MLAERVKSWTAQWQAEGEAKGRAEGREEGLQQALIRQSRRRFGDAVAEQARILLHAINDSARLEDLTEQILDCPDAESWLHRLGA